ncbi:MAG: dihydroorotase [Gemmatimonadales bacterium]
MAERPLVIRGGRVIDPSLEIDTEADVLVLDGKVAEVGKNLELPDGSEFIDASGLVVAPGLIDVHVHFREPGMEEAETIASGARAAAAGGFTGVCAMPNTDPVTDNQAAVGFVVKQGTAARAARVYPMAAITLEQKGQRLSEFGELVAAGAVAVSDDGRPVVSSHMMRTALEYARSFEIPVVDHCEDSELASGGAMHEGLVSNRLGLKGIPAAAEEIIVARDALLAELTGGHVHICHVSTSGSVEIIRQAKKRGANITAEVTPHHFTLTDVACEGYDTNAKMSPPLRESEDVASVIEGLKDGTVDLIATDHAPHHYEAKEREFDDAPFGVVGLETALGIGIMQLVDTKALSLSALIYRMSTMPARAFRLPGGSLVPGGAADVVLFDPQRRWEVDPSAFLSQSRNSPFAGWELSGKVVRTLVGGRTVFECDGAE